MIVLHVLVLLFVFQPAPVLGPLVAIAAWAATRHHPRARRVLQIGAALVAALVLVAWPLEVGFVDPLADFGAWALVAMVPWFAAWHLWQLDRRRVRVALGVVSVLVVVGQGLLIPAMLIGGWPDIARRQPVAERTLDDDRTLALFRRAHALDDAGWGTAVVTAAVDPWGVLERKLAGRTLPRDFDRGSLQVVASGATVRLEWQTADGPAFIELSP